MRINFYEFLHFIKRVSFVTLGLFFNNLKFIDVYTFYKKQYSTNLLFIPTPNTST